MKAGRLDRLVTIQTFTTTKNSMGEETKTWSDFAEVYARKRDISSREFFEAGARQAEITTEFTIRYRSDVTTQMRIQLDGNTYQIVGPPQELGRREGLIIRTKVVN